jgi:hypothetical protein
MPSVTKGVSNTPAKVRTVICVRRGVFCGWSEPWTGSEKRRNAGDYVDQVLRASLLYFTFAASHARTFCVALSKMRS